MAFRADESAKDNYRKMENYFLNPKLFDPIQREKSAIALREVTKDLGAVIDRYPTWHPLVNNQRTDSYNWEITEPRRECGYEGLDHSRYFVKGFITCPYGSPETVLHSVKSLRPNADVEIKAEVLNFPLYHPRAFPILVTMDWFNYDELDGTISLKEALSLMILKEIKNVHIAQVGETWKTMREYFLGTPCGAMSSNFINLKNGREMKKVWDCINRTGVYGPIYKRPNCS